MNPALTAARKEGTVARGIQVGDKAPDFTLPSQAGEPVRLSDRTREEELSIPVDQDLLVVHLVSASEPPVLGDAAGG